MAAVPAAPVQVKGVMGPEEVEWWLMLTDAPPPGPLPADPLSPDEWRDCSEGEWDELSEQGRDVPPQATTDELAGAVPGLGLAAALEAIDPTDADEYGVVEMIAGYQRLAAWATSRLTELAGHLARRPALNPRSPLPGGPETLNVAADEIAPRLGISRFAARRTVQAADLFRHTLEDTGAALREGRIDHAKALVLVRTLHDQPGDVAWEVQRQVLPGASHQTVTQLERAVAKAIIAVDPHRAAARHRNAREERRVGRPRVLPDGMASIFAVLPAADAAGLDLALEASARSAKAAGDSRTLDQLRADALALLGHSALRRGFVGVPHGDQPAAQETSGDPPVAGQVDPATDEPCDTGGFPWRGHMPIGTVGGRQAQIQVTVPLSVLLPPEVLAEGSPGPDEWSVRLQGDSCAYSDDSGGPGGAVGTAQGSGTSADGDPDEEDDALPTDWYPGPVPAEVAELHGYGPITPDVAMALAHAGGTWQRLVIDPLSGVLLDVGRTRYRPPAAIEDFVRLRDGTCVRPGCSAPAERCEVDHLMAWSEGGATGSDSLGCLCKGDHVIKTSGAFEIHHEGDGSFVWSTPSGHRYRRDHTGRISLLAARSAIEATQREIATGFGDEPPF